MIDRATLDKWTENARRDDWHILFVGSDIRIMLGEIAKTRAAIDGGLASFANDPPDSDFQRGYLNALQELSASLTSTNETPADGR